MGKCYPIRYRTDGTTSPPYRTVTGTPGTNPALAGGQWNITGAVKGSNVAVDAIRRGTGAYLTDGELISAGDASDNPCTFTGFAAADQTSTARWGILLDLGGGNFELQGRFVIGQNNAYTATAAKFRASNQTINIVDTPHAQADFTQIILDHASTRVEWTNIGLVGLGTTNPGKLVVNSANPPFIWNGGNNANIGTTTLRSNSVATGVTWRACDQVIANGADLSGSTIAGSIAASALLWDVNVDTGGKLDGMRFVSSGSGHGVELGPNCPSNISFADIGFDDGYGAADTANAMVYNNSGKAITIDRSGGTTLTIRNGTGASTVVNDSVALTISANVSLVGAEIRVYDLDTTPPDYGTELAGTESHNAATYVYSGASGNTVVIQIMLDGYKEFVQQTTMPAANGTLPITLAKELNA